MVSKSVLQHAKAYLCWDLFPNLTIQLIELKDSVGYYYPQNRDTHSILLFYHKDTTDFSKPLFLLFHEAGHHLQFLNYQARGFEAQFREGMHLMRGREKCEFETEAWKNGELLLRQFLVTKKIVIPNLILELNKYALACVQSYQD